MERDAFFWRCSYSGDSAVPDELDITFYGFRGAGEVLWELRRVLLRLTGAATMKVGRWLKDNGKNWVALCARLGHDDPLVPSKQAALAAGRELTPRNHIEWTTPTVPMVALLLVFCLERHDREQRRRATHMLLALLRTMAPDAELAQSVLTLAWDDFILATQWECDLRPAGGAPCPHVNVARAAFDGAEDQRMTDLCLPQACCGAESDCAGPLQLHHNLVRGFARRPSVDH